VASDALGNPLAVVLTPGQKHDCPLADVLLDAVLATDEEIAAVKAVLADRGYDSNDLVRRIEAAEAQAVIPSRKNRKEPRAHDAELYAERNRIERLIGRLKQYRRVATRYEKTARNYLAMVHLVCSMVWLA
jgi:transposase